MDRKLVIGAVLLLIIQVSYLFADLNGGIRSYFVSTPQSSAAKRIGELRRTERQVRRKMQSSLVWDESRQSDPVFEYDSILTLAGSSAQIHLEGNARLQLDENTLIVLEPNQARESGSIRIRFARGNLRSRNPGERLHVASDSWTMDVNKGSDVSLVSLDDGRVALEVAEGEVHLKSQNGEAQTIERGEKVRLRDDAIEEKSHLSENLLWEPSIPQRIYSKSFPVTIPLKWTGPAEELRFIDPQKVSHRITIDPVRQQEDLTLTAGTHLIELKGQGDEASQTLSIQVRAAPLFSYFSPFPRDRVQSGTDTLFSWQGHEGLHAYELEVSEQPDFASVLTRIETEKTQARLSLKTPGAFYWRVSAKDEMGYVIPAPRVYPIYSVRQPLEAPKLLNAPEIRTPAGEEEPPRPESQKGAGLFLPLWRTFLSLTLPTAQAEPSTPKLEALFTWTEVPGADHYIIEISVEPGFENPVLISKVPDPRFTWTEFKPGRYFWRVAAGRDPQAGLPEQRGYFSPPALARLESANTEAGPGIALRELPTPAPQLKPRPTPSPVELSHTAEEKLPIPPAATPPEDHQASHKPESLTAPVAAPIAPAARHRLGLWWRPGYRLNQAQNESSIEGSFSGPVLLAVGANLSFTSTSAVWDLDAGFERVEWKPKSPSETPFQSALQESRWNVRLDRRTFTSRWSFGLHVGSRGFFERTAAEEGALKETTLYGITTRYFVMRNGSNREGGFGEFALEPSFGDGVYGGELSARWLFQVRSSAALEILIGPRLKGAYYKGSGSLSNVEGDAGLDLGLRW